MTSSPGQNGWSAPRKNSDAAAVFHELEMVAISDVAMKGVT
jgi:hypothetical protein